MSGPRAYATGGPAPIDTVLADLDGVRHAGGKVVTTNGCFDLLHSGHVELLLEARSLGDVLVVGVNSDAGVRALKGPGRPVVAEPDRAALLAALEPVDHVVAFDERLPVRLLGTLRPDIHCKGADYTAESLPEAEIVRAGGGEVRILALRGQHSSTRLVERAVVAASGRPAAQTGEQPDTTRSVASGLAAVASVIQAAAEGAGVTVVAAADRLRAAIAADGTIFLCGNGGSAAQAQHAAAELVGRFRSDGHAAPAVALSTDAALVTAISNDFGFDDVFARQLEALGRPQDVLVAISTSGRSANVLRAADTARRAGMAVIGLTGGAANPLAERCDLTITVPTHDTAAIQVAHLALLHELCGLVEDGGVPR